MTPGGKQVGWIAALFLAVAALAEDAATGKYVQAIYVVENQAGEVLKNVEVRACAPARQTAQQHTASVQAFPDATPVMDAVGNQVVVWVLDELPPYAIKVLRWEANLESQATHVALDEAQHAQFLLSEASIESDAPAIQAQAKMFNGTNAVEKARAIFAWVKTHVRDSGFSEETKGAAWALEHGTGDCTEMACLFTALCRAAGIPARMLGGYRCERNCILEPLEHHNWAEFYDGSAWQLADVHAGRFMDGGEAYIATKIFCPEFQDSASRFSRFWTPNSQVRIRMTTKP